MTKGPKTNSGPRTGVTEDGLRWVEETYDGVIYRIRQLTVEEADAAWDASTNPDKTINMRMNTRLSLVSGIITPETTLDQISKWPNMKLRVMLNAADKLDTLPPASAEGEDSAPAS